MASSSLAAGESHLSHLFPVCDDIIIIVPGTHKASFVKFGCQTRIRYVTQVLGAIRRIVSPGLVELCVSDVRLR